MKKCPACNRTYDDSQSFCLMDGTALTVETETETIVSQTPARRKHKFLPVVLILLVFAVLAGSGIVGWFLFNKYNLKSDNAQNKRQSVNIKPTPTIPSTPTQTPSPSPVEEASPEAESSKDASSSEDTDEITPIDWDTSPGAFKGVEGQIYKLRCPEDGTAHTVYGSDIYTIDSSICTAAVHAGLITLADGGVVTVEIRPGRQIYGSTTRNGIKSNTWGPYDRSFIVR